MVIIIKEINFLEIIIIEKEMKEVDQEMEKILIIIDFKIQEEIIHQ
jgi:hypothetical protein